jgi:hypothetical protein
MSPRIFAALVAALGAGALLAQAAVAAPPAPTIASAPPNPSASRAATFTFDAEEAASFVCRLDSAPYAACTSPVSYSDLADGTHTFRVRAIDSDREVGPPTVYRWSVVLPPATILSGPTSPTRETTASFAFDTGGAPAECRLDGGPSQACSSPISYAGLPEGAHRFRVRPLGGDGSSEAGWAWTVDTTAPALLLPPAPVAEANGPAGAPVSYAVGGTDGGAPLTPEAVSCRPPPGSTFALGRTAVACVATDAAGNSASGSFTVTVRDTTPPTINAPDATLRATSSDGLRRTDRAVVAYRRGISAIDLVSPAVVSVQIPRRLPVGRTVLRVTARDRAGNRATKRVTLTVVTRAIVAAPDVRRPPAVRRARARPGDHLVRLTWRTPRRDVAFVVVRLTNARRAWSGPVVFRGRGNAVVVTRLRNRVPHRFVITAVDRAGNRSPAVAVVATPRAQLLARPRPNEVVRRSPVFRWAPVGRASYFNLQLFRGRTKVLSAWPTYATLKLPGRWYFDDRMRTLEPGVYTWYVWPGYGKRTAKRYGPMLGKGTFRVVGRTAS